jgi:glycosyltransferase involved in cell wall biosynthesis
MSVRLGIDARLLLVAQATGVERVLGELLRAFGELADPRFGFVSFVDRVPPRGLVVPGRVVVVPQRLRLLRPAFDSWIAWQMARAFAEHQLDAFLSPSTKIPLGGGPCFACVHGLEWAVRPADYGWRERLAQRWWLNRSSRRALGLVTFSNASHADLVRFAPGSTAPVRVFHEGVASVFGPTADAAQDRACLAQVGVEQPYLLAVASDEPRKDLAGLVQAFALLCQRRALPHKLVLVGRPGRGSPRTAAAISQQGLAERVLRLGYVPDRILAALYRGAALFVQSSRYEGFGLPLIEALASGAPVVARARGAASELLLDAGLLVEPEGPVALAEALERLLSEPDLAQALRAKGLQRARAFSFANSAQGVLDFLHERLEARP